jgi:hypothetical protein
MSNHQGTYFLTEMTCSPENGAESLLYVYSMSKEPAEKLSEKGSKSLTVGAVGQAFGGPGGKWVKYHAQITTLPEYLRGTAVAVLRPKVRIEPFEKEMLREDGTTLRDGAKESELVLSSLEQIYQAKKRECTQA